MTRITALVAALAAALALPAAAQAPPDTAAPVTWRIDTNHSELSFRVRHFVSRVRGTFGAWEGIVTAPAGAWDRGTAEVTVRTASIDTQNERRDTHLRSADFFDSEEFPKLTFKSTRIEGSGSTWKVMGDLTIKDVTKPVTLNVEWSGVAKDPWGNTKAGLNLSGKLDRKEFGLNWNAALEAGGVLVSDEVRILAEVQLAKQG